MKLLFCKACQDVVRLIDTVRTCRCGSTHGHYVNETLAVYGGEDAIPLGFANRSFARAVRSQPRSGDGLRFEAFALPRAHGSLDSVNP